ncbi:MAG: PfkB family carbohydrate kinase [Planctomycetota bacterium]
MSAELASRLRGLPAVDLTVVGDLMLDRFVRGEIERMSPEAPVPVLRERTVREVPGGAANLARGLAALGASVRLVGSVGADAEGARLLAMLREAGVDTAGCLVEEGRATTLKTRFQGPTGQLLRVDREERGPRDPGRAFALPAEGEDLLVVSDYGKGAIDDALLARLRARGGFVVDPASGRAPAAYAGARLVKPNRRELLGAGDGDPEAALAVWAGALPGAAILATLGGEGAILREADGATHRFEAHRREVFDVTGAGDSTMAAIALALAAGVDRLEACRLGMAAGAVAVSRSDTAVVAREELVAFLEAR